MTENTQAVNAIQEQKEQRNPFAVARAKAEAAGVPQLPVGASPLVGDPFTQPQPALQTPGPLANNPQPEQPATLAGFGVPQNSAQQTMDQKLMAAIKALDIKADGIAVNPLGKMLLHNRLKGRYGDKYGDNKDVRNLLTQFDQALLYYSDEASKSMTQSNNAASRTLDALRR